MAKRYFPGHPSSSFCNDDDDEEEEGTDMMLFRSHLVRVPDDETTAGFDPPGKSLLTPETKRRIRYKEHH